MHKITKYRYNYLNMSQKSMLQPTQIILPAIFRNQRSKIRHCNRIMVTAEGDTIYLPTYIKIDIKHFKSLNFEELYGQFFATIDIIVLVQDLPYVVINSLVQNLMFNTPFHGNISLNPKKNKKMQILVDDLKLPGSQAVIFKKFRISGDFKATIKPELKYTPLQLLDLVLTISPKTIQDKVIKQGTQKQKKFQIKFMLMDNNCKQQNIQSKINFNSTAVFGNYDLAQKKLTVQYSGTTDQKSLQDFGKDIFSFMRHTPKQKLQQSEIFKFQQHAHFHIPLYKFPCVPFTTIFVPLVILGIFNLAIFFQQRDLGDRINNLSALMIAFIGIIPVIRESIPPSPKITRIEQLVYLEIVTTLFCLFESWYYYDKNNTEVNKSQVFNSWLFIFSLLCTLFVAITPLVFFFIHFLILRNSYNQNVYQRFENPQDLYENWIYNNHADVFFLPKLRDFKPNDKKSQKKIQQIQKNKGKQEKLKTFFAQIRSHKIQQQQIEGTHSTEFIKSNEYKKQLAYKQKYNQIIKSISIGLQTQKYISSSRKRTQNQQSMHKYKSITL